MPSSGQGDCHRVVDEWQAPEGNLEHLRGTEWYLFRDGLIAEIGSYYNNYYLHDQRNRALWDFDYVGRGYRSDSDTGIVEK